MAQRFVCSIHPRRPPRHNPSLHDPTSPPASLLTPLALSPRPPSPSFPLSLNHQNRRSLYPFLAIMSAATQLHPVPQRSIQDETEDVRIAIRALDDMRHGALLHSPPHPPSSGCAYLPRIFESSHVQSLPYI